MDDAWFCGGSLITDDFVMTAGHCVKGGSEFVIMGRGEKLYDRIIYLLLHDLAAGVHDIRADSEPHRIEITSYEGLVHPDYDYHTVASDIALVRLPQTIQFSDYIRPACLPL